MILCVSVNPAIDRRLRVEDLNVGAVNRATSAVSFAGGKAAHVAMAAKALGEDNVTWIGFLGGSTGEDVERQLIDLGIEVVSVRTKSPTRVNDEIIDNEGRVTEILEPGGGVSDRELEEFLVRCDQKFIEAGGSFQVVFSGSLQPGIPDCFYRDLISAARAKGASTILDASGRSFLEGLQAKPDMIKPNRDESEKALSLKIDDFGDAITAAKRFIDLGAKEAVVSLGADGLICSRKAGSVVLAKPPKVTVKSTVGCGDATVAGLAVGAFRGYDVYNKLRLAVACGGANCLADLPGQIKLEDVERLLPLVEMSEQLESGQITQV